MCWSRMRKRRSEPARGEAALVPMRAPGRCHRMDLLVCRLAVLGFLRETPCEPRAPIRLTEDRPGLRRPQRQPSWGSFQQKHLRGRGRPTVCLPGFRFPKLFPPLKPETVARRTVEAVQLNQALLLLPWTMHILILLKRYLGASGEGGAAMAPLSPGPGGGELAGRRKPPGSVSLACCGRICHPRWLSAWGSYRSLRNAKALFILGVMAVTVA